MTVTRPETYYVSLLHELRKQLGESEWVEFKKNYQDHETIGEYISALSNSAALLGKNQAYLIWGVDDESHEITGTTFKPDLEKQGGEALENWLLRMLSPKIDFRFIELMIEGARVVILEIDPAFHHPLQFKNQEFIRVGSYKKR